MIQLSVPLRYCSLAKMTRRRPSPSAPRGICMPSNVPAIIGCTQGVCYMPLPAKTLCVSRFSRRGLAQLARALADRLLAHANSAHGLFGRVALDQVAMVDLLIAGKVLGDGLVRDVGEDHAGACQFLDVGAERAQVARKDRLALAGMARILDCMWVPLFEVKAGEYELIELNTKSKHVYTHLDNDRLSEGLHEALGRYHASGSVCEEDRRLAGEVLRGYASLRAETDVMRCKLCALLLPTYKLSGDEEAFVRLHDTMRGLLPVVKAPQSRALLLVTLYGCTDNALYRRMAHELVDPWQVDPSPKKSKLSLIHRLGDYDRWLGHESVDS